MVLLVVVAGDIFS